MELLAEKNSGHFGLRVRGLGFVVRLAAFSGGAATALSMIGTGLTTGADSTNSANWCPMSLAPSASSTSTVSPHAAFSLGLS